MRNAIITLLVLLCNTVFAQNHWIPNTAPYEDYMYMVVVVQIDGVEQNSDIFEVGAFCGDECRGSARAVYFPPTDRYLYQLPVYGNSGDVITFKLYDHEQQQEVIGCEAAEVMYADDGYGALANPYVMNFVMETPQPSGVLIELEPGWNWISYVLEIEIPLEEALANLVPVEGDIIKSQKGYSRYDETEGLWKGNLTTMKPGKGYIYLRNGEATTFTYPKP